MAASLFVILFLLALAGQASELPRPVSPQELWTQIQSGTATLIVDVRTAEEFLAGHVPGAISVPMDALARRLDELSDHRDDRLVVYCERGPRAGQAVSILEHSNFSCIRYLKGHMSRWRETGLPVE